jgi:phosphoglucosamine mutase
MLEGALVSGALSAGADVFAVSVLPTPGIAYLTRSLEAHGGVVLSASHNAFQDNGIKIFSSEGAKFPDSWEDEIEARLGGPDGAPKPTGASVGRLVQYDQAEAEYIAHARQTFPFDLGNVTLALDCAHGATSRVAPRLFRALGAKVTVLAAKPDGLNINRKSGAMHPERLQRRVRAAGADVGLAFDGDGDRLIAVDETGEIRDGDYALAICGRHLAASGRLKTGTVVTTVMANLGLDKALAEVGMRTVKTQVGDRYVLEEMVKTGANLGGEQSGHLLFLDHTPTGDGIVSALQLLAVMRDANAADRCSTVSELRKKSFCRRTWVVTRCSHVTAAAGRSNIDRVSSCWNRLVLAYRVRLRKSAVRGLDSPPIARSSSPDAASMASSRGSASSLRRFCRQR